MDANNIKFTYQVTYPPKVYILIYFYETNQPNKINPDFRQSYLIELADFITHLKELLKTNNADPRKTHILDTLEGITSLNEYLLDLWKIKLNTQKETIESKQGSLMLV